MRYDALMVTEGEVTALWRGVHSAEYSVVACGMERVAY